MHGCNPLKFEEFQAQEGTQKQDGLSDFKGNFQNLDDALRQHIRQAMLRSRGKIEGYNGAAQLLDLKPGTLRQKMRKLGIPFGKSSKEIYQ